MLRRTLLAIVVATTALQLAPAVARAALVAEPLPGEVAGGQLGGPIYDVVYSVDIPAGFVLVASLTGTAGTDFDMYLFDSSATSLASTVGLVAKSTGPTSTESLTWASSTDATYYIDLNGASNVEGAYTLRVNFVPDPSPPSLRLALLPAVSTVNQLEVTLQVLGSDDQSGLSEMAFSIDGVNWLPWESYSPSRRWLLVDQEGSQTVYAQVRNGVGMPSPVATLRVVLDRVSPRIVARDPAPGGAVGAGAPNFTVTFDERIDPSSWFGTGLTVRDSAGAALLGSYAYDEATLTGSFRPYGSLAIGADYSVTLGSIRDLAGNGVEPSDTWTVKALQSSSASLSSSVTSVSYGGSVRLSGRLSIPAGESGVLEMKRATDSVYAPVSPVATTLSLVLSPRVTTTYRLRYAGSSSTAPAVSRPITVTVRRVVTLVGPRTTTIQSVRRGARVTLTARVRPASAGVPVSFRLLRYDAKRRAYRLYRTYTARAGATGLATHRWTTVAGRWAWQVRTPASDGLAAATSGRYRWVVR